MPVRHRVEFLGAETCGADVVTCRFSRPEGYSFRAGQWFRLTLLAADGELTKTFSHNSAPDDSELMMTTRLSGSSFKNAIKALAPGDFVEISEPGGRLTIPPGDRVCFLTGGTGITPVRSLLRDAQHVGRRFADALLLYGNRDESCAPFAEEFAAMGDIGVRLVLCYEHPPGSWAGERGFITAEAVRRYTDPADGRPYIVSGPPAMVSAMERVLDELGVEDDRRMVERFTPQGA